MDECTVCVCSVPARKNMSAMNGRVLYMMNSIKLWWIYVLFFVYCVQTKLIVIIVNKVLETTDMLL